VSYAGAQRQSAEFLASENVLRQKASEFFETSRGGDITYQDRQVVCYPNLHLARSGVCGLYVSAR